MNIKTASNFFFDVSYTIYPQFLIGKLYRNVFVASAHSGFGNTELRILYRFPQVTVYKPCLRTPDANTKVSKPV
jgi:hypothetical protein